MYGKRMNSSHYSLNELGVSSVQTQLVGFSSTLFHQSKLYIQIQIQITLLSTKCALNGNVYLTLAYKNNTHNKQLYTTYTTVHQQPTGINKSDDLRLLYLSHNPPAALCQAQLSFELNTNMLTC